MDYFLFHYTSDTKTFQINYLKYLNSAFKISKLKPATDSVDSLCTTKTWNLRKYK